MRKSNSARALGLAVLLLLAIAVQPAEANGWRRFVDSFVPESIREFFGGSPPEPAEEARRMLSEAEILRLEEPTEGHLAAVSVGWGSHVSEISEISDLGV